MAQAPIIYILLDFMKAFDRVNRAAMEKILCGPQHWEADFIKLVHAVNTGMTVTLQWANTPEQQEWPLSPILFILTIEPLVSPHLFSSS